MGPWPATTLGLKVMNWLESLKFGVELVVFSGLVPMY